MAREKTASLLRVHVGAERVTTIELFFDLVYVFAVTQLSHYLLGHLTPLGALETLLLWFAVWLGWQYTCWVTNWFDPRSAPIRLMRVPPSWCAPGAPDPVGARHTCVAPMARPSSSSFRSRNSIRATSFGRRQS